MELRAVVMTAPRFGLPIGKRLTEADRPIGQLQTLVDTAAAKWDEPKPKKERKPKPEET